MALHNLAGGEFSSLYPHARSKVGTPMAKGHIIRDAFIPTAETICFGASLLVEDAASPEVDPRMARATRSFRAALNITRSSGVTFLRIAAAGGPADFAAATVPSFAGAAAASAAGFAFGAATGGCDTPSKGDVILFLDLVADFALTGAGALTGGVTCGASFGGTTSTGPL
jgi:hypothetical protein